MIHQPRSAIGRTNMLKEVTNSLGGRFTLDYEHTAPTYGLPGGKWVMSSVTVDDGIHDDGPLMMTRFAYSDGMKDRHEREFLGFGKVISKSIDTEKGDSVVYRQAVQPYDVSSYYAQGNELGSSMEDAEGNKYTETRNEYDGYDYVNKIGYDKFEQRSYLKYCNGAETFYTYDPQRRRLQNLAVTSSAGTIMDNAYSYDAVSNVLSIANAAPLPQSGKAGGRMSHTYGYDALYRLTSASGTYRGADSKSASYSLAMSYDNMHRIKSKSQHLTQQGVQFDGTLNAGYDLAYTYQDSLGHKFQLSKIEDLNYRTEGTPKEKIDNGHRYLYDANGNLVYINTSRVKKDGKEDEQLALCLSNHICGRSTDAGWGNYRLDSCRTFVLSVRDIGRMW